MKAIVITEHEKGEYRTIREVFSLDESLSHKALVEFCRNTISRYVAEQDDCSSYQIRNQYDYKDRSLYNEGHIYTCTVVYHYKDTDVIIVEYSCEIYEVRSF